MTDPTLDDLLAKSDPGVRAIAHRARELVLAALPDAVEKVHMGWRNATFGVSPSMADPVIRAQ